MTLEQFNKATDIQYRGVCLQSDLRQVKDRILDKKSEMDIQINGIDLNKKYYSKKIEEFIEDYIKNLEAEIEALKNEFNNL